MTQLLGLVKSLVLIGILEIVPTAIAATAAESQLPKPPNTGTPTGNPTPATTRSPVTCPKTDKPVTALIANNHKDYTTKEYPTLWFYIPYSSGEIRQLEFVLLDGAERQTIYRTGVKLSQKPGFIAITVPANAQYALQPLKTYRWYLMLDCQNDPDDEPALVVNGWITRLAEGSTQANSLWYDKINDLAKDYFTDPNNQTIHENWVMLLQSLGYTWLIEEPLANSTLTTPLY